MFKNEFRLQPCGIYIGNDMIRFAIYRGHPTALCKNGLDKSKWIELIQIKNNGNEKWRNGEKMNLRDD